MPNAVTHDRIAGFIGVATIPITQLLVYQTVMPELPAIYFPIHDSIFLGAMIILCNYYLSPDLDIISAPYYRWGKLKFIWLIYQKLIKHRHWLSHSGPISFTLRLLYITFPFIILCVIYKILFSPEVYYYVLMFWIAGSISDTIHMILDAVL